MGSLENRNGQCQEDDQILNQAPNQSSCFSLVSSTVFANTLNSHLLQQPHHHHPVFVFAHPNNNDDNNINNRESSNNNKSNKNKNNKTTKANSSSSKNNNTQCDHFCLRLLLFKLLHA